MDQQLSAPIGVGPPRRLTAKTPASVIAFLNKHLNEAIHSESFKKRIEPLGMTVPEINTPETFLAFMQREIARQAELAKLTGHATEVK